jgi:hypothetical protein
MHHLKVEYFSVPKIVQSAQAPLTPRGAASTAICTIPPTSFGQFLFRQGLLDPPLKKISFFP